MIADAENKNWLYWVKIGFGFATILSIAFILYKFYQNWPSMTSWRPSVLNIVLLLLFSFIYAASLFLLASIWVRMLDFIAPNRVPKSVAVDVYARSQVAKYIPGNIFQFVGRHFYLAEFDVKQADVARASLLEIAIMIASALSVALVFGMLAEFSDIWGFSKIVVVASMTLAFVCLLAIIARSMPSQSGAVAKGAAALMLGIGFFLVQTTLYAVIGLQLGWELSPLIIFAAAISWIVGYVTPGAPGGVGVRELFLFILLQDHFAQQDILLTLALFRVVTLFGDVTFYFWGKSKF